MYVAKVFIFIYCFIICFFNLLLVAVDILVVSPVLVSVMSNVMSVSGWLSFSLLKNSVTPPEVVPRHSCGTILILFFFFFFLKMSTVCL